MGLRQHREFPGSVKACQNAISDLQERQNGNDVTVGTYMEYQSLINGYLERIETLRAMNCKIKS